MTIRRHVESYLSDRTTGRSGTSTATTMRMLALGCLVQGHGAEASTNAELARLRNVAMGEALRRTFTCTRCHGAASECEALRREAATKIKTAVAELATCDPTTARAKQLKFYVRKAKRDYAKTFVADADEHTADDDCGCRRRREIYELFVESGRKRRQSPDDPNYQAFKPIMVIAAHLDATTRTAFRHLDRWETNLAANYKRQLASVREFQRVVRGAEKGVE